MAERQRPPPLNIDILKTVLLTGASGFLGRFLREALESRYAVTTLGRSAGADVVADLAQDVPLLPGACDLVVHCAGKAHIVPRTAAEAAAFHQVNHEGTLHLLQALEATERMPRQLVLISTVAVYGREEGEQIGEDHPLDGQTPYALSKIRAEKAVCRWAGARGVPALILRLPLVVGPGAPGNLAAIRKAIARGYYISIRDNTARKSMVAARDVARLIAGLEGGEQGAYNLTDGVHPPFSEVEKTIAAALQKQIRLQLPLAWLEAAGRVGEQLQNLGLPFPLTRDRLRKMTATLTFSDAKARQELGWNPAPALRAVGEAATSQ